MRADNSRVYFPKNQPIPYGVGVATTITDPKKNVTSLSYVAVAGIPVLSRVADPSGHYLDVNYTVFGTRPYITSVVSSDGRSVSYSYTNELLTSVSYPDGTSATYTYTVTTDPIGTVYKVLTTASDVRAEGIPSIRYDLAAFSEKNLAGYVKNVWNNADGSLVVRGNSNANGPITPTNATLTYPDGRLYTHTTESTDGMVTTTYSVINNVTGTTAYKYSLPVRDTNYNAYLDKTATIQTTNAKNKTWTEVRTMRGKLLSKTVPGGATATFTYDADGYQLTAKDENGQITRFTRDPAQEWITQIDHPDGTCETFSYNGAGQILTHTRRNGGTESFTYTADGMLQTQTSATGQLTT